MAAVAKTPGFSARIRGFLGQLVGGKAVQAAPLGSDLVQDEVEKLGYVVRDSRVQKRFADIGNLDVTDDEQVISFTRKNFSSMIPYMRAGDEENGEADRITTGYSRFLQYVEWIKDNLMVRQKIHRHTACNSPVLKLSSADYVKLVAPDLSSRSGDQKLQLGLPTQLEIAYCPQCKKTPLRSELLRETIDIGYKSSNYEMKIASANRTLANMSRRILIKTWRGIDLEFKPIVFENKMPSLGNPMNSGQNAARLSAAG